MVRPFYVTVAFTLVAIAFAAGCDSSTPQPPQARPSSMQLDAALDSIEQWLAAAQPEKAEVVARGLISSQPDLPAGHAAMGRILLVKVGAALAAQDPAHARTIATEALGHFTEAHRLGNTSPEVIRGAGIAAEQAQDLPEAIRWYRLGAGEDQATALYLGLALLRTGEPREARAIIGPMCLLRPNDPFLQATHAECLAETGAMEEAHEAILEAIRLAPDEPAFRIRRAALLRKDGEPLLAAETILALPESARVSLQATEELAAALAMVERFTLLATAWSDHARAHPDSTHAIVQAAGAWIDAKNLPEAQLWIDVLRSQDPRHPQIQVLVDRLSAGADPRQGE